MLSAIINIMLTILAVIGIIIICLLVVLIFVLVTYYQVKDAQKANNRPEYKLTFDGPSRIEMNATTARLMKADQRRYRRPYMRAKLAMSPNR